MRARMPSVIKARLERLDFRRAPKLIPTVYCVSQWRMGY